MNIEVIEHLSEHLEAMAALAPTPVYDFEGEDGIFFPGTSKSSGSPKPLVELVEIAIDPTTKDPKQGVFDSSNTPVGHPTGTYKYKVNFGVHRKRAIANNIFDIKFILSTNTTYPQTTSIKPGLSPWELEQKLNQQEELTKDFIKKIEDSIIWEDTVSIRDIIDWDESDAFNTYEVYHLPKPKITQKILIPQLINSDTKKPSPSDDKIGPPGVTLDLGAGKKSSNSVVGKSILNAKKSAMKMVAAGVSPCIVANKNYKPDTYNSINGVTGNASEPSSPSGGSHSAPLNTAVVHAAQNIGPTGANALKVMTNSLSHSQVPDPNFMPTIYAIKSWAGWKSFHIEVDKDLVGTSKLFMNVILIRKEVVTKKYAHKDVYEEKAWPYKAGKYDIDNYNKLLQHTQPQHKPSLTIHRLATGVMKIIVEQNDYWATGVVVTRTVKGGGFPQNPDGTLPKATVTPGLSMPLTLPMGPEEITDFIDTTSLEYVAYQAYAVGPLPEHAPTDIIEKIMKGIDHPNEELPTGAQPVDHAIFVKVEDDGKVYVDISAIDLAHIPEVTHLQVLRETVSNRGFFSHYNRPHKILTCVSSGGSKQPYLIGGTSHGEGMYVFVDDQGELMTGEVYRYYARFYTIEGDVIHGKSEQSITYLKPLQNPPYFPVVDLVATIPWGGSDYGGDAYQITLDLTADTPAGNITSGMLHDLMKELLGAEVATTFASDFKHHKRKLQDLAAFHVVRYRESGSALGGKTGFELDLGVWLPGIVKDKPLHMDIEEKLPLMKNCTYRYEVELLLRAPDFFFDDALEIVPSNNEYSTVPGMTTKAGTFFTALARKIKETYPESQGLPSEDLFEVGDNEWGIGKQGGATTESFMAGRTGIKRIVHASTVPPWPEMNAPIKKLSWFHELNRFAWRVEGTTDAIHSYLIIARNMTTGDTYPQAFVPHENNRPDGYHGVYVDPSRDNKMNVIHYKVVAMFTNYATYDLGDMAEVEFLSLDDSYSPWQSWDEYNAEQQAAADAAAEAAAAEAHTP